MNNVTVEVAQSESLPAIARIHYESLSDDFLPSLGLDFLEQVYYQAAIQSEYAATLVAFIDGKPVGFVTVAHDSRCFTRDILRGRLFVLAKCAFRAMLRDPHYFGKSLEVFWSAVFTKPDPIKSEIVFIAVDRAYRGQGIGKKLVILALDFLRQKAVVICRTKTLAKNSGVIKMYEDLGWHVRDRFRLVGREYVTIVKESI